MWMLLVSVQQNWSTSSLRYTHFTKHMPRKLALILENFEKKSLPEIKKKRLCARLENFNSFFLIKENYFTAQKLGK